MAELPTGTVTFLFTDVEGSTRLLHDLGDGYADVLAEHRRVLRDAFARHGGVEVDTQGDAFFVAFAKASDAVAAAAAGRAALDGGPVRVRMGLHTGEPTVTDEGYVGMDVHRAARIAAAGHGGQILVSQATRDLVASGGLRDLGAHRLKDLGEPERIFQLGDGEFPPLKTLNNSNLPLPAEPLVGRKKELADVLRLFHDGARLVTITGPGGIGKTRFALDLASELVETFRDGVWWVGLAPVRDTKLVLPTIAAALGAKMELEAELRPKRALLLLDNFEQVVDAAADVARLHAECRGLVLLVTSREPLHVAGEREYPLSPLREAPAVELLRQRARAVSPDFNADYRDVAAVCERLDGLPLAIELAAARTKSMPLNSLVARLDRRLPVLTSRRRDVEERQRTLRATIEWSYDLLDDDEKDLFERLSVFAGSFDADASEEVCEVGPDALESFLDKSLLRLAADGRFFMLETIREYAHDLFRSNAHQELIHRRHTDRALRRACCPNEPLARIAWRASVERDYANFRAALERLRDVGNHADFLQLASRLGDYWDPQLRLDEGAHWLEQALSRPYEAITRERARALNTLSHIRWRQGAIAVSRALNEEAEEAARALSDDAVLADVYSNRGGIEYVLGDLAVSLRKYECAVALYRVHGPPSMVVVMEHDLGIVALQMGDSGRARRHLEESLRLSREMGVVKAEAGVLMSLGQLELEERNLERAAAVFKDGLRLALEHDVLDEGIAHDLYILAEVTVRRGQAEAACVIVGAADAACELIGLAPAPPAHPPRDEVIRRADACLGGQAGEARGRGRTLSVLEVARFVLALH